MRQALFGSRFTGLRARLLAIILLAVVPIVLVLIAYAGYQTNLTSSRERATVQSQLEADVRSLQGLIAQSRATLVTFGITYAIQAQNWALAQGNTTRLQAEHPDYAVIAVADRNGRIRASSGRSSGPVNVSDEPAFQRAVASRGLTISNYSKDPFTGRPSIGVSLPVYDSKDRLVAVEYIGFNADQFRKRLSAPSPATVVTLIDGGGNVVVREPVAPNTEGGAFRESALVKTVLAEKRGNTTLADAGQVVREYYFAPLFSNGEGALYLTVGFSADELLAGERRAFTRLMIAIGAFALLALVVVWLIGTYSIYRPTLLLEQAATQISTGDLTARVDLGNRGDELGSLGRQFNDMADSLQQNVEDLQEARTELSQLNTELEERVRRRTAELEASNKELEAFSYSVSHDLRSPLRAIDGFSLALIEDYSDALDEQGRDDLRRVRDNATRMGELIDSLLKLSRLSRQEMDIRDVDLSQIVEEVAHGFQESDPQRDVAFRIVPGVHAMGDAALLRIVLENLMANAWKFTSKCQAAVIEFGARESMARPRTSCVTTVQGSTWHTRTSCSVRSNASTVSPSSLG